MPALKIPVPIWFALLFRRWLKVRLGSYWAYVERHSKAHPTIIYLMVEQKNDR